VWVAGLGLVLGNAAVAFAALWQSPRQKAALEQLSPKPAEQVQP
jgi:hypothetical protein